VVYAGVGYRTALPALTSRGSPLRHRSLNHHRQDVARSLRSRVVQSQAP
jgi:hypothetical protein